MKTKKCFRFMPFAIALFLCLGASEPFFVAVAHALPNKHWSDGDPHNLLTDGGFINTGGGGIVTEGGTLSTKGGWVMTGGGAVHTQGGYISTDGGNVTTQGGNFETDGGRIGTNGGDIWTAGGQIVTHGGEIWTDGGNINTGNGGIYTGSGEIWTGTGNIHSGGDLYVRGNTSLQGGLGVRGPAVFHSGLSAGGNKITDVADGRIAPDSMDAINGSQLYKFGQQFQNQWDAGIKKAGASSAALAALKPLDFDPENPTNFNVGYGNYRGASAVAVGLSHYFTEDVMFNAGTTIAEEPMLNAGLSIRLGKQEESISSHMGHQKQLRLQNALILKLKDTTVKQADEITLLKMKLHMVQEEIDDIMGLPSGLYGQQRRLDRLGKRGKEGEAYYAARAFKAAYARPGTRSRAEAIANDTAGEANDTPAGSEEEAKVHDTRGEPIEIKALDGSVDWIRAIVKDEMRKAALKAAG